MHCLSLSICSAYLEQREAEAADSSKVNTATDLTKDPENSTGLLICLLILTELDVTFGNEKPGSIYKVKDFSLA